MLYAFLPDYNASRTSKLFGFIKTLVPNKRLQSARWDYQTAVLSAIKECFPEAALKGYFFHLVQNIWKHSALKCAIQEFNMNMEFALKVKMVAAIALGPVPDFGKYIATLEEYMPEELHHLFK